jgi:eukaryotic-like serine/threonine-protein kinase
VDPSAEKKYCPECGTPNSASNKFCIKCGTVLPALPDPAEALPPAAASGKPAPTQLDPAPADLPPTDLPPTDLPPTDLPTMVGKVGTVGKVEPEAPPVDSSPTISAPVPVEPSPDAPTRLAGPTTRADLEAPSWLDAPKKQADAPTARLDAPQKRADIPTARLDPETPTDASAPTLLAGLPIAPHPRMDLPPSTPPPSAPPVAPGGSNNRMLLIGGGIVAGILLLACVGLVTMRAIAALLPTTPTQVAAGRTPTSAATDPTEEPTNTPNADLGILRTAQAEQDATSTAEAIEPTEEPTTEPTEEPTTEPTEEPTTEPTEPPADLVASTFTAEEAQTARTTHDTEVKSYQRLLFESFEEGNRTKARWAHSAEGRRLVNNRYELTIDIPSTYNFDLWKQQPANLGETYTIESEVRFLTLDQFARVGVAFDVQADTTQNWLYLVGSDGNWYIFRNEERIGSGVLPEQFSINADTPYVLWVWRLPTGVLFFFNGELVAFITSETIGPDYPTGKVGVVGVSGREDSDVPVTVVVDNLLVARKP